MKKVGLATLLAFLAAAVLGAGNAPLLCCGTECPACPPVMCKDSSVLTLAKAPILTVAPALPQVSAPALVLAAAAPLVQSLCLAVSSGFVRPMRN